MRSKIFQIILIYSLFFHPLVHAESILHMLTAKELDQVGLKIWHNESARKIYGLTTWNKGEQFASMGIGHFIWYPKNKKSLYEETFPEFLFYAQNSQIKLPVWLSSDKMNWHCPYKTREEFYQHFHDKKLTELRQFLMTNLSIQTQFIIARTEQSLVKILRQLDEPMEQSWVEQQFFDLFQKPEGVFALIDYINFKGDGTNARERYQDNGWGLLQVLLAMKNHPSDDSLSSFIDAARTVLVRRVSNAPADRHEEQWLPGWINRIESYRTTFE